MPLPTPKTLSDIRIGIGLRHAHYSDVLDHASDAPLPLDFLEVHAENFFARGGAIAHVLDQAALRYPMSLHGVGLSLGSACGIDPWHLAQLKRLVDRVNPILVSDHACFGRAALSKHANQANQENTSSLSIAHANDLLPIRFTRSSLDVLCANVSQVQDTLKRRIGVENISAYIDWDTYDYSEVGFLNALSQRTGCGLLMDLNNIYVNALNQQIRRSEHSQQAIIACQNWIETINADAVMEIHLAGFTPNETLVIDDHASPVHEPVWQLYRHALRRMGHKPTLIEWDLELPEFSVLLNEAAKARLVSHNL